MIIIAMVRQYEYPPLTREIQKAIGVKSSGTVGHRVKWLIEEGYLTRTGGQRTLQATEKGLAIFPEFFVMVDDNIPISEYYRKHLEG